MQPSSTRQHVGRVIICVMAIAVVPYLNALTADYTFDDVNVVRDNDAVHNDPPMRLLETAYYPGAWYRPLTMLTYAANARVSTDAFGYHLFNIGAHALVAVGVYALGRLLFLSHTIAVVAALLFAVHPSHTEAVTGIVGRAEVLAALFVIAALLALGRQLRTTGPRPLQLLWSVLSLSCLALALLAKESAFTTIALVPLLHRWLVPDASRRQRLRILAPYVAVGIAYLGLRLIVVGSLTLPAPPDTLDNPLAHAAPAVRVATALVVLCDYLLLLIVPLQLAADYSFNAIPLVLSAGDPRLWTAVAILLLAGAWLAHSARRMRALAPGVWLTIIPLALTANVLFPIGTIKAERLLYLPSVGACFIAGTLCAEALRRSPRTWQPLLVLIVAVFALRTWSRNFDWQDNLALFQATVAASPNSAKAHYNVGVFLQHQHRFEEALVHYHRALEIYPSYTDAEFGIARVHELRGNVGAAMHWYDAAVQHDWTLAKAHLNIGRIYLRAGAFTAAEAAFRTGLQRDPFNPALLVGLSAAELSQGDRWGARALIDELDHVPIAPGETLEMVAAARHEIAEAMR